MSLTTNFNYLQPTGFKIVLNRENYPNFVYFAQSVNLPGINVNAVDVPHRRITGVPFAGDKITYNELNMQVLLDEEMRVYEELYAWLVRIVNEGHVPPNSSTKTPTYSDITVIVLSSQNNETLQIRYKDCIITNIGDVDLNANTTDVEYRSFPASFRFSHFEIVRPG